MGSSDSQAGFVRFHGNCHCQFFKFSVLIAPATQIIRTCNCSICRRKAYQWMYPIIEPGQFLVAKGLSEDSLTSYEFGDGIKTHKFCPRCGTSVLARRNISPIGEDLAINARALQDLNQIPDPMPVATFNGKYYGISYSAPPPLIVNTSDDQKAFDNDGLLTYYGNCHCGKVRYRMRNKKIEDGDVLECNCSSCSRNGDLWIYPKCSDIEVEGLENLTGYAFLSSDSLHSFCTTCGVSVLVQILDKGVDRVPLNVCTIQGLEVEKLKTKKFDGKSRAPKYVLDV